MGHWAKYDSRDLWVTGLSVFLELWVTVLSVILGNCGHWANHDDVFSLIVKREKLRAV